MSLQDKKHQKGGRANLPEVTSESAHAVKIGQRSTKEPCDNDEIPKTTKEIPLRRFFTSKWQTPDEDKSDEDDVQSYSNGRQSCIGSGSPDSQKHELEILVYKRRKPHMMSTSGNKNVFNRPGMNEKVENVLEAQRQSRLRNESMHESYKEGEEDVRFGATSISMTSVARPKSIPRTPDLNRTEMQMDHGLIASRRSVTRVPSVTSISDDQFSNHAESSAIIVWPLFTDV